MRAAGFPDLLPILEILRTMHEESRLARFPRDEGKVSQFVIDLLMNPDGIVLVTGEPICGVFLGVAQELWFSRAKTAFEVIFYVLPEHRGGRHAVKLINGYKARARELGAQEIKISEEAGINPDLVERFYSKMGFSKLGTAYLLE